jgi:hypothetical protein
MSKALDLRKAHNEVEDHGRNAILCLTCDNVPPEGEAYCLYCKSFWEDVANGLFDSPAYAYE